MREEAKRVEEVPKDYFIEEGREEWRTGQARDSGVRGQSRTWV